VAEHNSITELAQLPDDVLAEVVREGEATLAAQLTVSMAADQRALAFASVVLTAATAALGGVGAIVYSDRPDWGIVIAAGILAAGLMSAGAIALYSARPSPFCLPGNEPRNWLPGKWSLPAGATHTLSAARVEQAGVLQSLISKNREASAHAARYLRRGILIVFSTIAADALILFGVILGRIFE
jgi:hypothetical protein